LYVFNISDHHLYEIIYTLNGKNNIMNPRQQSQDQQNQSNSTRNKMTQEQGENQKQESIPSKDQYPPRSTTPSSKQNATGENENHDNPLPDDVEADKKEISRQENTADDPSAQPYPKQRDNEDWKTGSSGIPENASDNPHH
jgi:hypothetical protein